MTSRTKRGGDGSVKGQSSVCYRNYTNKNSYQCYNQDIKCNPDGNHKEKSYRLYTEGNEKFKHFIINQLNTEDDSNAGNKDKKAKKQVRAK